MFQYKFLHRTILTNTFLYKCRLVETELCAFCGETRETILHLFCDCNIVKNIWLKKVIFHAIYPELCHFAGGSIDAEKIYILYLYLSKDITPEKEGTTFWN
jgi:hypothetical protein